MKKAFNILMLLIGVAILAPSCSKSQRTYTEMLKDERKAIRKLMDSLDFRVIDEYPKDGKFAKNEFFKTSSGLYVNVVDTGNGNRAVLGSTVIHARFEIEYMDILAKTVYKYNGHDNHFYPMTFIYIHYPYGTPQITGGDAFWGNMGICGEGIVEPLSFVGENAVVNLIVPFKLGGQGQQRGGDPVYYKNLKYRFDK